MNLTATSAVVVDGADVKLAVTCGDESSMALPLGPADRIALACDLMAAARRHLGRAVDGQFRLDPEIVQEIRERAKDARAALCAEALARAGLGVKPDH